MIKITLTGIEAEEYIKYRMNAVASTQPITVSMVRERTPTHVEEQSKKHKDIKASNKKPDFAGKQEKPAKESKKSAKYTDADIKVIYAAVAKRVTNKDRTVQVVAQKLGRSVAALRAKLFELGFTTVENVIHLKD